MAKIGYIAELWKTTKTGQYKGIPRFWKKVPIDNVKALNVGEIFTICSKKEVKYYIDKIEHVYYGKPTDEYYMRFFVRRF